MAIEDKYISNKTTVSNSGGALTITTSYLEEASLDLSFFISQESQSVEGLDFIEGDLGYTIENSIDYFSKPVDNLIVVSEDTSKYSIVDGKLILTT